MRITHCNLRDVGVAIRDTCPEFSVWKEV
jgi:hypothetical protein